jgi:predicted dehydrogenase
VQQVAFYYTAGIANTGSHMFDLLRFFFGEAEWVRAVLSENRSPNPQDPNIDGLVKFRSGALATVQACDAESFSIFEMDCIGTNGRLRTTHGGFDVDFYYVAESQRFSGYRDILKGSPPFKVDGPREFFTSGVRHLVECMQGKAKPISSGEDGRASLELICAFHQSARADGEKVGLPLRDSEIEIHSW